MSSSHETDPLREFHSERVVFATRPESPAIMVGRAAAVCAHPFAGWTLLSTSWRLLILAACAAAGYVIAFCALLAIRLN